MSHEDQTKLIDLKKLVESAELSLQEARQLLDQLTSYADPRVVGKAMTAGSESATESGQVIEGVFDGQQMVGPDGKRYSVPANYASKSKLVEGDMMKLTIDGRGSFIFKQIGPVNRVRLRGSLTQDEKTGEWRVLASGKAYKILLASVTYFKGQAGDDVIILAPQDKSSTWAAVENIIKQGQADPEEAYAPIYTPAEEPQTEQDGTAISKEPTELADREPERKEDFGQI